MMGGIETINFGYVHLKFQLMGESKSGKTEIVAVWNQGLTVHLGDIKWYAKWRKYCFYPNDGMLFDTWCLLGISDYLKTMNRRQAAKRNLARENAVG